MTDWHELMQIYKEAEKGKRTCLYEWQMATDRAADRMGRDLDLTVLLALEISFPPFSFPTPLFLCLCLTCKPLPSCYWRHLAAHCCLTWARGAERGGRESGPYFRAGLRWVTFVTQGCAVVISLSVGTRLSWLFLLRKMDRLTQELTASQ